MSITKGFRCVCLIASLALYAAAAPSEYHGQASFGGLPVPGATVTAAQGERKLVSITDQQGVFR